MQQVDTTSQNKEITIQVLFGGFMSIFCVALWGKRVHQHRTDVYIYNNATWKFSLFIVMNGLF